MTSFTCQGWRLFPATRRVGGGAGPQNTHHPWQVNDVIIFHTLSVHTHYTSIHFLHHFVSNVITLLPMLPLLSFLLLPLFFEAFLRTFYDLLRNFWGTSEDFEDFVRNLRTFWNKRHFSTPNRYTYYTFIHFLHSTLPYTFYTILFPMLPLLPMLPLCYHFVTTLLPVLPPCHFLRTLWGLLRTFWGTFEDFEDSFRTLRTLRTF